MWYPLANMFSLIPTCKYVVVILSSFLYKIYVYINLTTYLNYHIILIYYAQSNTIDNYILIILLIAEKLWMTSKIF